MERLIVMAKVNSVTFGKVSSEIAVGQGNLQRNNNYLKKEKADNIELSSSAQPRVSTIRAIFKCLSQTEIDELNKSGRLPKNVKITRNPESGKFCISRNWFNISRGTHIIPEGYELRKNLLGFTEVVPIGEEGITLRKK